MSSRSSKRQRTGGVPAFGAPLPADGPSSTVQTSTFQTNEPSSRSLPVTSMPSLVTLCARGFVSRFRNLRTNTALWDARISRQLQLLPDPILPRLFAMLRKAHSGYLSHEIIVTYFLRGPSISLPFDSLPGANKNTVLAIPRLNTQVKELELSGFDVADEVFANVVKNLHSLKSLVLRGCTKAGAKTVVAVATSCHLKSLNLNDTSATPAALATLVIAMGHELEVLKISGISNWTDATFAKFVSPIKEQNTNMPKLQTLKLRGLALSDHSIDFFVSLCPNLKRLDTSFTSTKHPFVFSVFSGATPPPLEKLNLTSTPVTTSDLISMISLFPNLQTLSLGALGVVHGSKSSISNSSALTLNDDTLRKMTDILQCFTNLQTVSLVSNAKLGQSGTSKTTDESAIFEFIRRVGRKLTYLNLSGIPSLRSYDLTALMLFEPTEAPPALKTLVLNNTGIDDDSGACIACCTDLVTLEVAGTKFTSEGLFPIIDACTHLERLNLTSCRGVRVADRRRFFEVWQSERGSG